MEPHVPTSNPGGTHDHPHGRRILTCAALLAATGCSSNFGSGSKTKQDTGSRQKLTVLIATSGDAETNSVKEAAAAYAKQSATR